MPHPAPAALLPPYSRVFGPVSQARVLRLLGFYLAVAAIGFGLAVFSHQPHLEAFGLGLVLPGGGFLSHYDLITAFGLWHLAAAIAAAGLFVLALGVWFGTGNVLAPPVVWLATAVWAAAMNHGPIRNYAVTTAFAVADLILAGVIVVTLIRFYLAVRHRRRDNAYLVQATYPIVSDDSPMPEMSVEDLQWLRFALDRALQPVDRFGGFETLDQFQTAATRYQINFLAYGIALNQARFTPAFGGYARQAQINLIDKQAQPRVWAYWGLENLWGNLRRDINPVGQENIMYTGFVALQMALLTATTGVRDFGVAGRFRLTDELAFRDSDLIARLSSEFDRAAFGLVACEPNWVYPLCNTIGASAMLAHDRQYAGAAWRDRSAAFRTALDSEFLDAFGRFVPCRSERTGLALPAIGGVMPLAMPCFFLNAIAPDIARRQWLLLRRRLLDAQGHLRRHAFWRIDTGNYGFTRASAYTATALAAAELGDRQIYDLCLDALEDECPSTQKAGVIHRSRASVWSHGVELMARASVHNSFRDLLVAPLPAGPRLEDVAYPDVLVAAAHAQEGGLYAVLYGDGVHRLRVTGLVPAGRYYQDTTPLVANDDGELAISIPLSGRTVLRLRPEV